MQKISRFHFLFHMKTRDFLSYREYLLVTYFIFYRKRACIACSHARWFQSHCKSRIAAVTFYDLAFFVESRYIMWTDSEAFLTSNTSSLMYCYYISILCPFKNFHRTCLHTRCILAVLTASCYIIYQSGSL